MGNNGELRAYAAKIYTSLLRKPYTTLYKDSDLHQFLYQFIQYLYKITSLYRFIQDYQFIQVYTSLCNKDAGYGHTSNLSSVR